ncbi:hypothetical protein M3Y94_01249500 [Aphelenchoides besseyi]|nr:hypothetical protein M3Y94_01249500 [Aphelenchoides besseyi]
MRPPINQKPSCSTNDKPPPSTSIQIREMMINGSATLGRQDTYPFEEFRKGTLIWIKDPERVWVQAELLHNFSFNSPTISLKRISDEEHIEYNPTKNGMPFPCNPKVLLGKDDLTSLSYLHEPAVLNNLQYRFERLEKIYTYCGIVLVAINPYTDCSHFYGDDVIRVSSLDLNEIRLDFEVYQGQGKQVRGLVPHIFAIAEESFFDMREYGKNQAVIVSGESGAGKTVSAKFVMRYLTHVAGGQQVADGGGIESRVLASNPVMEAIGNARTIRNDNSSRFGKFIQIHFTDRFNISGAEMKTYLLEKSRVVYQSQNERNYHIFYQMAAAREHSILQGLELDSAADFHYTNQGDAFAIPGVDDEEEFRRTISSLSMLGVDEDKQRDIFRVLAGVLHLGNVGFVPANEQAQIDPSSANHVNTLCSQLFQVDANALALWLSAREIRAGPETVRKPLNIQEAINNRDALSKLIYACVFNWIVDAINGSLSVSGTNESKRRSDAVVRFVGVLDIYGFETFDQNSFEQFCINYANEKLQQSFNQHVFKLEQAEYEREDIAWVRIDYYDNQACIDLIEARPGLIDYLDEQCKTGRGTDEGWLGQMQNCPKLKTSEHLQMPKINKGSFIVKHFASDVCYNVDGFLEKNKDTVNEQLLEVISKTKFKFLREVTGDFLASSSTGVKRKKTYLHPLVHIMFVVLNQMTQKERFLFEPKRAIQQLRACGVLETVRISATGYPSRWSYEDFKQRYGVLLADRRNLKLKEFAHQTCQKWLEAEKFALGKTKIFFRTGQVALLEKLRHDTLADAAIRIQSYWRGFVQRRRYLVLKNAIRTMQATCRAFMAYRRMKFLQMHRAAISMQSTVRGYLQRRRYERIRTAIIEIQSRYRAMIVRREFLKAKYERSALTIQRHFRGYLVRREQIKRMSRIVKVQSCVRRWLAKRRLRDLKQEARSVNYWQDLHRGLANKVIELQRRLDVSVGFESTHQLTEFQVNECNVLKGLCADVSDLNARVIAQQFQIEALQYAKTETEQSMQKLRERLQNEMEEKQLLQQERDKLKAEVEQNQWHITDLFNTKNALQDKLDRLQDEKTKFQPYRRGLSLSPSDSPDDDQENIPIRLEPLPSQPHSGFLEVRNVPEFARILINDLKPQTARRQLSPGLPANLFLAAFRYFDRERDDAAVTALFTVAHTTLRNMANKSNDIDSLSLWLVNSWQLLNLLRQYSGEDGESEWHAKNTEKQNGWRIQHFNFAPIRQQLTSRIEDLYYKFMKNAVEPSLMPKIVPCVLQHESVSFSDPLSSNKKKKEPPVEALYEITKFMGTVCTTLRDYGADLSILEQVFNQIAKWICETAMNQLIYRKDLCNLIKAIQIKQNVREIQTWLEKHKLTCCTEALEPLIQATHVMLTEKTDSQVDKLCNDLTTKLTVKQVVSILENYRPAHDYEEEVTSEFIKKVKDRLSGRRVLAEIDNKLHSLDTASMSGTQLAKFNSQSFVYSNYPLDQLTIPSILRLELITRFV